jgi:hypothetical protein
MAIKKAGVLSGQLLKVWETGVGDALRIDEKTLHRIGRHRLYGEVKNMLRTVEKMQRKKC